MHYRDEHGLSPLTDASAWLWQATSEFAGFLGTGQGERRPIIPNYQQGVLPNQGKGIHEGRFAIYSNAQEDIINVQCNPLWQGEFEAEEAENSSDKI